MKKSTHQVYLDSFTLKWVKTRSKSGNVFIVSSWFDGNMTKRNGVEQEKVKLAQLFTLNHGLKAKPQFE